MGNIIPQAQNAANISAEMVTWKETSSTAETSGAGRQQSKGMCARDARVCTHTRGERIGVAAVGVCRRLPFQAEAEQDSPGEAKLSGGDSIQPRAVLALQE